MAPRREYPRQPRRPIRQVAPTPATRGTVAGSLALADPVVAVNPFQSGAQIYPTGMTSPDNAVRNPNPPIDTISNETPPLTNYGATGTSFFGGIIQSDEYNREFGWRDAVIKYEQMSRNDSQIMAIKQQFEMPILAAKWSIEPASDDPQDQEIASFVQSCLMDDMCYTTSDGTQVYQSWNETLRQILMYKWYGFSLLELCFRIEDGWVKWSRWLPLLPRTVWRWYVGADNELESVEQWAYKEWTYQYNRIPRGKLLHFANRMEGQNYQGISVLRSAFANWWYKQQFLKIAAIEIERNAIIPPVIKMGPGPSSDEVNAALKLAQNIRANELMGVVIGHDMEFQYPRMTERGAAQILPLIEYHDNMIARNILGQFINLGSHEVGSYALAQQQYTNFLVTAQGDCQYVCDVINHQAIRQLVDYNYDGVAVYPKLTVSRLVSQDITTLSNALQYLAAYVPPSPEVNDAIADALGLPKPPQSMVETTNPTSPTTPERPENERADDHTSSGSDTAQTAPGHASGGGGGTSGNAGYQDTQDSGGGDGTGFSEQVESQALTEFRLLRESLDAFSEHVTANDAVERGVRFLGGHEPGYQQNRGPKGQWGPGDGDAHVGGSGSGRSRGGGSGGAGGGESSHPSKSEHAATAKSSGSSGSSGGSGRGSSKAAKGEKPAKETRVTRKHLDDAETAAHEAGSRARMAQVHHAKAQEELVHAAHEHDAARAAAKAAEHEFTTRVQGVRGAFTLPHQVKAITQAHEAAQVHERNAASRHRAQQELVHIAHRDAEAAQHEHEAATHHLDQLRQAHEAQKAAASQAKGEKAPKEPSATKTARAPRAPKAAKTPAESIHERSARLQKEGGLKAEVTPAKGVAVGHQLKVVHMPTDARDRETDVTRALDPYRLAHIYGEHQLGLALHMQTPGNLKEAADIAGVKVSRSKAETVSRIVSAVTEGRYSANFAHAAKGEKTSTSKSSTVSRTEHEAGQKAAAGKGEKTATAKSGKATRDQRNSLTPVGHVDPSRLGPDAKPGDHLRAIRELYGDHQLGRALQGRSADYLRQAARDLGLSKVGTSKGATIKAILKHLHINDTGENA